MTTGPDTGTPEKPAAPRELLPTATPARTRAAVRDLVRPHRALACGQASGSWWWPRPWA